MKAETISSSADLTAVIDRSRIKAPWFAPMLEVVRDHGVVLGIIGQGAGPFSLPEDDRPFIVMIGDDLHEALGPTAFHRASMVAALRRAAAVIVMSSAPNPDIYAAAAGGASMGASVVFIETRIEQEASWLALLDEVAPKLPRLVSTVQHGHC